MANSEEAMHDILLIVSVSLFIFMALGVGVISAPASVSFDDSVAS